jgi:hypothetical protein
VRHNFVNDIGDYAKYALLRVLSASSHPPLTLGVIWYLTEHAEHNGDGRRRPHLSQDGWEQIDPELLAQMRSIESSLRTVDDLHLNLIEDSAILPADTVYFSKPLPDMPSSRAQRVAKRAEWFAAAKQAVADCNLIFLDPDNGLEVKSAGLGSRLASKYVTISEMVELLAGGKLVILYQHCDRSPWQIQRAKICDQLTIGAGQRLFVRSVRFGAFGARAFFCLTLNPDMAETINAGIQEFAERIVGWDKAHTFRFD